MNSLYFDDVSVGLTFRTALSEPFSREAIEAYFQITGDVFAAHRDDGFARRFGLTAAMVPGNLVVDRSTGLVYENGHFAESLFIQAGKHTRFVKPVYPDECIYVVEAVRGVEDRPRKPYGRIIIERKVFNDRDELVVVLEQDDRMLKRSALRADMDGSRVSFAGACAHDDARLSQGS